MKGSIFILVSFILCGVLTAGGLFLDNPIVVAAVPAVFFLIFIFTDYRVGVVGLAFCLPLRYALFLPYSRQVTIVFAAVTTASFIINRSFRAEKTVPLPKPVLLLYFLPAVLALLLAIPHLGVAARNFAAEGLGVQYYLPEFLISGFALPMLSLLFALFVANAVCDSRMGVVYFRWFALAAAVPAIAIVLYAPTHMGRPGVAGSDRQFLDGLGMHANDWGVMMTLAVGPLLFLAWHKATSTMVRFVYAGAASLVTIALCMTFSRAAVLGLLVIVCMLVLRLRRPRLAVSLVVLTLVVGFAAPDSLKERLTKGLDTGPRMYDPGDPLTAGRTVVWRNLAPDVLESPLWGRGLRSTAWSSAVNKGQYSADHPHNLYLEILLDIGLLGLAALAWLWRRYFGWFRELSKRAELSGEEQAFFAGSMASLVAMLVMGASGGHWMPYPEHTFLYMSLGLAIGYRAKLASNVPSAQADVDRASGHLPDYAASKTANPYGRAG